MSDRIFYQSHECEGFRAKVTIEWSMPVDGDLLPPWRKEVAEDIADSILAFSGKKMRDMVQAMRGYTPHPPAQRTPIENAGASQSFQKQARGSKIER